MKYISIFIAFAIVAFGCSEEKSEVTKVYGNVQNPAGNWVYMQELKEGGFVKIDSTEVNDNGDYEFSRKFESEVFLRLNFSNRQIVNLILTGYEDNVKVDVDGGRPDGFSEVSGSKTTAMMRTMDSLARKKQADIQLLNQEAMAARNNGDSDLLVEIRDQYFYLVDKYDNLMKEKIEEAAPSIVGIYGINYIKLEDDIDFASKIAEVYKKESPDHFFSRDLISEVANYKKLAIGSEAPEIELQTPDGEMLALSSLRGNYVLIDFWAAWCRPCRAENPNVVKLYNEYKDENFEIFGVSLDRKKDDWIIAIEKDGLTWKHVSDLKYFNSEAALDYNVNAIPATYLIGPDGKIIAKGLRGESLRSKLKEIFEAS